MNSGGLIEARGPRSETHRRRVAFPPVNSGGLIEAACRWCFVRQRIRRRFPPVNSGGLIEAPFVRHVLVKQIGMFPPVNSGGLIEALIAV